MLVIHSDELNRATPAMMADNTPSSTRHAVRHARRYSAASAGESEPAPSTAGRQ